MSKTVKTGWLEDKNGDQFAPKTYISQVVDYDGTSLEKKIVKLATDMEVISMMAETGLVSPLINSNSKMFIDNNNNIYIL